MTFGIKTEGAEKAAKDIDGVASSSKKAEESQEGLNESITDGTGALGGMAGGAITAFKGVVGGVKKAVMGMRTLKGAIAATGIGLLVLAVVALVSYFTKTKRGAEVLQVATAALGAITGKITDVFSSLGEKMVGVFTNPKEAVLGLWDTIKTYFIDKFNKVVESVGLLGSAFKKLFSGDFTGAFEDAKEGATGLFMELTPLGTIIKATTAVVNNIIPAIKSFVKEVKEAVSTAAALERRAVALKDAQRELGVEFAQTRQAIREQRLIGEDLNKSYDERVAAMEKAGAMEQVLADKSLALAQEAVDIKRQQNEITESSAEDLQDLADLEIALAEAQTESLGKQTALLMRVNALYVAQAAEIKATEDAEQKRITDLIARQAEIDAILMTAKERELLKITEFYQKKKTAALADGQIIAGIKEAERKQIDAINDKYDKLDLDKTRQVRMAKVKMASQALGVLTALSNAFASDDDAGQRKAFERNKKFSIGQAVINTAVAISDALAKDSVAPFSRYVSAAMAGAMGLAQVVTIGKTKYASTSTPDVPSDLSRVDLGLGGSAEKSTPQLDLGFLGAGAGMGNIQAYVISEQVTTQQQADQVVTDQTTL